MICFNVNGCVGYGTVQGGGMREGPFILVAANMQVCHVTVCAFSGSVAPSIPQLTILLYDHLPEFEIVGIFSDSYV